MTALRTAWRGETYHGLPALKPAEFNVNVGAYIAILGASGAAQVLGTLARPSRPGTAKRARALALAGSVVGPAILVGHLKTPKRWYNMLRIIRPASPMSWGSWALTGFGASSFAVLGAQHMGWRGAEAAAAVPAVLSGAVMATYTAALLSATSNPLWAAAPGPLGAAFGASSVAAGASAMALIEREAGQHAAARRLEGVALLALGVEAVAMHLAERRWRDAGVGKPMQRSALHQAGGKALGLAAPALLAALGRPRLASLAVLAGSALMRQAVLRAGDASAQRPQDSLGFAR